MHLLGRGRTQTAAGRCDVHGKGYGEHSGGPHQELLAWDDEVTAVGKGFEHPWAVQRIAQEWVQCAARTLRPEYSAAGFAVHACTAARSTIGPVEHGYVCFGGEEQERSAVTGTSVVIPRLYAAPCRPVAPGVSHG